MTNSTQNLSNGKARPVMFTLGDCTVTIRLGRLEVFVVQVVLDMMTLETSVFVMFVRRLMAFAVVMMTPVDFVSQFGR